MRNGAIWRVRERLPEEDAAFGLLTDAYGFTAGMREKLRNGDVLCAG
jgi:hypothetical protein